MTTQLDLFELSETDVLRRQIETVKTSSDNVRRGIFARHNALAQMYLELATEVISLREEINNLKKTA